MEVKEQYKELIEGLINEIALNGYIQVIHGGSEERPTTLKHDRTVSLKNLISSYKQLTEIYPETQSTVNLRNIRDNL